MNEGHTTHHETTVRQDEPIYLQQQPPLRLRLRDLAPHEVPDLPQDTDSHGNWQLDRRVRVRLREREREDVLMLRHERKKRRGVAIMNPSCRLTRTDSEPFQRLSRAFLGGVVR